MSLLTDVRTNVVATNVFAYAPPKTGPTGEGTYGGSVWPKMRGPTNNNNAQCPVMGPTLGAGLLTGSDGAVDYAYQCPVFNESGHVFEATLDASIRKFDATGTLLYSSPAFALSNAVPQLAYAGNNTLFFCIPEGIYKVVDTGSALVVTQILVVTQPFPPGARYMILLTAQGNLIFNTVNAMYCMTQAGVIIWQNTALVYNANGWNMALDIESNLLYVVTPKFLYAVNADTGVIVHATLLNLSTGNIYSAPAIGANYVYFGIDFGLVACTKDTKVAWMNRELNNCADCSLAYNAALDTVYVCTALYSVAGVNGTTGATVFTAGTFLDPYNVRVTSPILDAAGSVYVASLGATDLGGKGIYKFSATGVLDSVELFVTIHIILAMGPNGQLYMGTSDGLKITV